MTDEELKEGKNVFLIWLISTIIGEIIIFKTISILFLKIITMIVCPILAFFLSMILGSIFVSKIENDQQRQNIKLLTKRVSIFCIWFIGTIVGITITYNNITKLSLKIILIIICPIISLILSLIIGGIFNKKCKFLNDNKLLDMHYLSYDVFYSHKKFCSVSDSIEPYYEKYNGITRKVSSTNEYLTYCLDGGKGCPIFEQYKNLSKRELYDHYANKF